MGMLGKLFARGALLVALLTLTLTLTLTLALASGGLLTAPAHAAPRHSKDGVDTVTLSAVNSSYAYGDTVNFQAVVTLAAPQSANYIVPVKVTVDSGQSFESIDPPLQNGLTYTFNFNNDGVNIPVGAHTAVASFDNVSTGVTTQSTPASFTITQLTLSLGCEFDGSQANIYKAATSVQVTLIRLNGMPGPAVNWAEGTATVTFSGPTTVTFQPLQPDSSGNMTITTPSQVGDYHLSCTFSGSSVYSSAVSITNVAIRISEFSQLGGVQLYTNPTTFVGAKSFEVYVVFQAASGLPTPTGTFDLDFDISPTLLFYSNSIAIGSDGTADVTFKPNAGYSGGTSQIRILFNGDDYYSPQNWTFTGTNPPIPTNGSGGSGAPTQPKATATPRPKATATPRATATATASSSALASGDSGAPTNPPSVTAPTPHAAPSLLALFTPLSWSNGALWLAALLVLLALGSGAGTFILLGRRGVPVAALADMPTARLGDAPTLPMQPPSADDTPPTSQPGSDI